MPQSYLYDNGLPFSNGLSINLDDLKDRVILRKASLIIVDGGVGEGKTTKGIHIADYYNSKEDLPKIILDGPQLAMGGVQFLKKMRLCYDNKLPCIIYDEAGDFTKRGSLTGFNRMLNRTFETYRAFKCIVILCLPNFMVLDNLLFDNEIPRMLLHLHDRTMEYGNYSGYSLHAMMRLKSLAKKYDKNYAFKIVDPNFVGHFLDLTPDRSKELDRVTVADKLKTLRKSEIDIEGLLAYPDVAMKLFKSVSWVRHAVAVLKIKPAREIGRVKYFDREVLNILSEHLDSVSDKRRSA